MIRAAALLLIPWAGAAAALSLDFPANARLVGEEASPLSTLSLATGAWDGSGVPGLTLEGAVTRQAWQVAAPGLTTLQLLAPLREQIEAEGYEVLYDCEARECGGFDFRFERVVLPPPAMFVDLSDFRYLSARKGDEGIALLVSRTSSAGFVQLTTVGPAASTPEIRVGAEPARSVSAAQAAPGDLGARLEAEGHVVLSDLVFASGSAQLAEGEYASLADLADYLIGAPDRRVALVGHTDSVGALDPNIALSKRRAGSVLERLATEYGVPRGQLAAEGMGYLAPVASNLTEAGREANRRVEVILLSTGD